MAIAGMSAFQFLWFTNGDSVTTATIPVKPPAAVQVRAHLASYSEADDVSAAQIAITKVTNSQGQQFVFPSNFFDVITGPTLIAFDPAMTSVEVTFRLHRVTANFLVELVFF